MAAGLSSGYFPLYPHNDNLPDQSIRTWITNYFQISDSQESNELWVQHFTKDAHVTVGPKEVHGEQEIRKLREDMWTHVKTRRHAITKVFPARFGENGNNETECELMLFGDVSYITKNNESSAFPFAAHGILKKSLEGEPVEWKYQYYRVWLQKD